MVVSIIHNYSRFQSEIARIGQALELESLYVVVEKEPASRQHRPGAAFSIPEVERRIFWGWTADSGVVASIDPAEVDRRYTAAREHFQAEADEHSRFAVGRLMSPTKGVRSHVVVSWSEPKRFADELAEFAAMLVHVYLDSDVERGLPPYNYLAHVMDLYSLPVLCTDSTTILHANPAAADYIGREFGPRPVSTCLCTVPVQIRESQANMSALLASTLSGTKGADAISVVEALEHQQRRIGIDLHDGLGQLLTAARIASYDLAEAVGAHSSELREQCLRLASLTDEAMALLRAMTSELSPLPLLKEDSFVDALESLVEMTHDFHEACCTLEYEGDIEVLDPTQRTHAFRIVQEAVNNAVKHSDADCIHISAKRLPGRGLVVEISDDGIGFQSRPEKQSLGMESMRYRAKELGAELSIHSAPDRRTIVTCRIPC